MDLKNVINTVKEFKLLHIYFEYLYFDGLLILSHSVFPFF